jgi:succinate-semialdehyde dehydrogenase / glutarate-semialdehyde dehydrogenase
MTLQTRLLIDGAFSDAEVRGEFAVTDPATGQEFAVVADATEVDAARAVDAAAAALPAWAARSPRDRSDVLRRAFDAMIREAEPLAQLITRENGKAIADARAEVAYAAEFFRWFSEEAVRSEGSFGEAPGGGARNIVVHKPIGVALLITPWNFPAAMATRKIAPALAAGCTVIVKPAAETPLTTLAIAELLREAGVPEGVVNVLPTSRSKPLVAAIMADPRVRKLSFTGSTEVGRALLHQAADRVVNTSMELGGNAPFVIAADADIRAAVNGALVAKLRNGGQACTAANRFYVHSSVVDEFVAEFGAAVALLRVGPGSDPETQIGPLVSWNAVNTVTRVVDEAVAAGAVISHRAEVPVGGFFYPPTVLRDVPPTAEILRTEIFGPVAPVTAWTKEDELVALVNASEFGLASYVYSADLGRALRIAERLDTGMVGINRGLVSDPSAPFGGTKQSGIAREGAREGLRAFQETQYISVDWPA